MVHAHYQFFTGDDAVSTIADLNHGLAVQRIVRETADHLAVFKEKKEGLRKIVSAGSQLHFKNTSRT
jgi:hypothetical protein